MSVHRGCSLQTEPIIYVDRKNWVVLETPGKLILCYSYKKVVATFDRKTEVLEVREKHMTTSTRNHFNMFVSWIDANR